MKQLINWVLKPWKTLGGRPEGRSLQFSSAIDNANRFLDQWPKTLPRPYVGVDGTGDCWLDWFRDAKHQLSCTFKGNVIAYYGKCGSLVSFSGDTSFNGGIPQTIIDLIEEIYHGEAA